MKENNDKYIMFMKLVKDGKYTVNIEKGKIYSSRNNREIGTPNHYGHILIVFHISLKIPKYGKVQKSYAVYAHRIIYLCAGNNIPAGMMINHINGVSSDNRISNLECVTPSENGLHSYRVLKRGFVYGERIWSAKLTSQKASEIRELYKNGNYPQKDIAKMFGVSRSVINSVIHNKSWKQ